MRIYGWEKFLESKNNFNLDKMYKEYNKKYFKSELPEDLSVTWNNLKDKAGVTLYQISTNKETKEKNVNKEDIRIEISNIYNKSETQISSVMLHEMIHVWLLVNGVYETTGGDTSHGKEFEKKRKELQKKSGITISVTEDIDKSNIDNKSVDDLSYDVIHYKKGNKDMIAVFKEDFIKDNKKEFKEMYTELKKDKGVSGKVTFFNSEDGIFLRYPVKDNFSQKFYECEVDVKRLIKGGKVYFTI